MIHFPLQSKINLKLTYSAPAGAGGQWRGGGEGDGDKARGERDVMGGMEGVCMCVWP